MRLSFSKLRHLCLYSALLFAGMALIAPTNSYAQKVDSNSLAPEALSAKSLLEDLLVKRFSQDLSTKVQKDLYSISSQIELSVRPEDKANNNYELIDDLSLGALDPESLMKNLSGPGANEAAANILKQFKIKSVQLAVGLDTKISEDKKAEVQTWLEQRIKKEFGNNGKGEVSFINRPAPSVATFLEQLKNFENLAGQVVMALALLLGALLWGLLASKKAGDNATNSTINVGSPEGSKSAASGAEGSLAIEKKQKEQEVFAKDISIITEKLVSLLPRVSNEFDGVLKSWCQQGEAGRVRLVCFAEAVGKDIGKLPIPVDAVADVTKVFSKMMHISLKEKKESLEKAYWDFLAVLNLGTESLNQPFSYIGGLNVDTINEVLIEQNPKMRTLVALYMPEDLRGKYINSLDLDTKKQILQSATDLNEIPVSELKTVDGAVSNKVKSRGKSGDGVIQLEMTLQKVVGSLNAIEKLTMLKDLQGAGLNLFKRTTPSSAFLHEWPDDGLTKLISRSNVDELVALSRIRPDLKEKVLTLSPPMTAEMAKDELNRLDTTTDNDKIRLLTNLEERIQSLVDEKELDLETIFSQTNTGATISKISTAA